MGNCLTLHSEYHWVDTDRDGSISMGRLWVGQAARWCFESGFRWYAFDKFDRIHYGLRSPHFCNRIPDVEILQGWSTAKCNRTGSGRAYPFIGKQSGIGIGGEE